jgi:hypothetical protein
MNVYSATITSSDTGSGTVTASSVAAATTSASTVPTVTTFSEIPSTPSSKPTSDGDLTLNKGAVAGIIVGSALAAVLLCTAVYYLRVHRHHQRPCKVSKMVLPVAGQRPQMSDRVRLGETDHEASMSKQQWALPGNYPGFSIEPRDKRSQGPVVEAPGESRQVFELPERR